MDPIKVDFSNKGARQKEIVIPPEKAGLKTVISIILTVVTAAVAYYFMLPALSPKSYDLYLYLGVVAASFIVWQGLLSRVMTKPEYTPYVKKQAIVPGIIIGVLVVVVAIGWIVSCQFFRAKSYSKIIDVQTDRTFSEDIAEENEESFASIPRLDESSATQVATRALSSLSEMGYVSQFTVYGQNYQINYKETPVRVAPLQYANIIKWLVNTREGFPGYVIVDMADESAEFKESTNGNIRYSTAEHFNKLVKRQLRFNYPTYLFADATFEIDDEGNAYWICGILDKTIGLFGGTDVIGAIVMDAATGECKEYSMEELRTDADLQWIDRVYSSDLIVEQYNYYGKYQGGFWNSILGQKNVVQTTTGYSYLAKDDDVWMYTGVSSVTSDESITGFVLVNQRTKEAVFYSVSGGTESSAQTVAEARVKDLGYTATFPLLLNIGGEPTYFMSLKDMSGGDVVMQYALINVKDYNNNKMGANGTDIATCLESYISALKTEKNITVDIDTDKIATETAEGTETADTTETAETKPATVEGNTATGTVADIRTAVKGGESYYYIKLDSADTYYTISASDDENVVILNKGDNVTITFSGNGSIVAAESITIK